MELNVKLTADELMNVVDAALSAMGIEIVPADEDDEDDEEEADPIADMLYVLDDGRTAISFEDACFLMDMIKETGIERGLSDEEATEAAKTIFMQIGKDIAFDSDIFGVKRNTGCGDGIYARCVIHKIRVQPCAFNFFRSQIPGQLMDDCGDHLHMRQLFCANVGQNPRHLSVGHGVSLREIPG